MRVLHLIDTGGPGGAETMFSQLVSRWPGDANEVLAVVSREGWLSKELRRLGHVPMVINPKGSLNLKYLNKIQKLIRNEKIDVVIAHLFGSCIYGSLAGLLERVPVIGVLHGQSDVDPSGRLAGIKSMILRKGLSQLVCVSEQLRATCIPALRLPMSKVRVIHNGIDTNKLGPLARENRNEFVIGAVGNIRRPKSYDILLQSAALVFTTRPDIRFKIVGQGEGKLMDELLALRKDLGLDDVVEFTGFQTADSQLYNEFDLYVSSSTTEGFSLTCIEAMACGVPVLATRSGGPEEIIGDGQTGVLVDTGNPAQFANQMLKLADDQALRELLSTNGRKSVIERFGIDSTVSAYVDLCRELV